MRTETQAVRQVEYTINDNQGKEYNGEHEPWMNNSIRQGFERLVRKLLQFPSSPAVIVLHYWKPSFGHFWATLEDEIDVIAKYYSLPSLSFRNTFYRAVAEQLPGFRWEDFVPDQTHPNALGSQYLAYTVISFFEAFLAGSPLLAAPLQPEAVLPPMFPGNEGSNRTSCKRGDTLRNMTRQVVAWEWVPGEKAGWTSSTVGAHMELSVKIHDAGETQLSLGYLHSSQSMGAAELTCHGGCMCIPQYMDAHHTASASMEYLKQFSVNRSHAGHCLLTIRISGITSSSGHNFKVLSLGLGEGTLQNHDMHQHYNR